jgi:hypothetical protein
VFCSAGGAPDFSPKDISALGSARQKATSNRRSAEPLRTITWSPLALGVRTLGSSVSNCARCSRVLTWLGWRRPPARWRAAHQALPAVALFISAAWSLRSRTMATSGARLNKPNPALPSRSRLRLTCSRVSIESMARPAQLRVAIRQALEVRPNPSIERTSTGLARSTSLVHVPLRGPIRFRRAHVKR